MIEVLMKKRIWDTVEKDYYKLYFISICIAGMSILMITSATYSESGMFYVSRQLIFILVGVMLMVIGAHFNILIFLFKHSKAVYIIAVILLLLLKSSLGVSSHGATRWLRIPFIQIQPVEVMKFGLIVLLARFPLNYICLFNYLFISSQMSAKPYFIGSTGILPLW